MPHNHFHRIIASILFVMCCGCGESAENYLGQQIVLPKNGSWKFFARDTTAIERRGMHAIIMYYDSKGCTPCRMKDLHSWKPVIDRIRRDSLNVDIIPVFNLDKDDNDLQIALRSAGFDLPVMCDEEGELEKNNRIPEDHLLQTFLVNRDNNVVLVGTPIYNPEMWEAYITMITQ